MTRREKAATFTGANFLWWSTSLLAVKKCGIRAPFVARSLRFVGTPHRAFWMVCSCGHDRMAGTLERSRVREDLSSNLTETGENGRRTKAPAIAFAPPPSHCSGHFRTHQQPSRIRATKWRLRASQTPQIWKAPLPRRHCGRTPTGDRVITVRGPMGNGKYHLEIR